MRGCVNALDVPAECVQKNMGFYRGSRSSSTFVRLHPHIYAYTPQTSEGRSCFWRTFGSRSNDTSICSPLSICFTAAADFSSS